MVTLRISDSLKTLGVAGIAAFGLWTSAFAEDAQEASRQLQVLGMLDQPGAFSRVVAMNHRNLVDLFLSAKTDINAVDAKGRTPLLNSVIVKDRYVAERLLKNGARADLADNQGITPLMLASAQGNQELVRSLLEHSSPVDAVDQAGRSALHYALAAKRTDVADQLLNAKSSVDLKDEQGRDALAMSAETRNWAIIKKILELNDQREWDFGGRSALQQAVSSANVENVRLVLSKHRGSPTPEGCSTPLLAYAVAANDLKMTQLLLEAGADPNTALTAPAEDKFLEYIQQKFLRHYLSEEDGITLLMVAAGIGNEPMVKLLLQKGAARAKATQSKYRLVPIYFAAWGDHAECIQALIEGAPDPGSFRIEVNLASQNATVYRDGIAEFQTGISSGRAGFATPTGRFVVTDKKQSHMSTIYKVKMPFFMRLSCKDFGMHEGYVPEYPASHGCIRLPSEAAKKLFKEVPIGTLVTISN